MWQQVIDELATYMTTLYSDAETYLIEVLAYRLEHEPDLLDPPNDAARARLINELRHATAAQLATLAAQRPALAEWVAQTAVEEGAAGIRDILAEFSPRTLPGVPLGQAGLVAMQAVAVDLVSRLEAVESRMLRFPDDVLQKIQAVMVTRKLTGAQRTIDLQRELLKVNRPGRWPTPRSAAPASRCRLPRRSGRATRRRMLGISRGRPCSRSPARFHP